MTSKADADWHRTMAAHLFNSTWTLIEKKRRTREERDTMIHMAHASRYHWGVVGGPKELAIGEWQISHVYAVVGRPEPSLFHAQRCLEICEANKIGDFPLAYAYEALARAFALAGLERPAFAARMDAAGFLKSEQVRDHGPIPPAPEPARVEAFGGDARERDVEPRGQVVAHESSRVVPP